MAASIRKYSLFHPYLLFNLLSWVTNLPPGIVGRQPNILEFAGSHLRKKITACLSAIAAVQLLGDPANAVRHADKEVPHETSARAIKTYDIITKMLDRVK